MERESIDGHNTIGGGAVIRLNKEALERIGKGLRRMDQSFIQVGPAMVQLAKVIQELTATMRTVPEPENTAHLGMTPDGGYRAPDDEESLPIRSLPILEDDGSGRYGSNGV